MGRHPLDRTTFAGLWAEDLMNKLLAWFRDECSAAGWDELADKHLTPMLYDMFIRGTDYADRFLIAQKAGHPGTAYDVALTGWAYLSHGIRVYRAGRQIEAVPLLRLAERCFGVAIGRLDQTVHGSRAVASLFDAEARKAAVIEMHERHMTDQEIADELSTRGPPITRARVQQIRTGKSP